MKNLNIFYFVAVFILLGVLGSCTKDPEVIEFDDSYVAKKPMEANRKKVPPIDLLTHCSYFIPSNIDVAIHRIISVDGTTVSIDKEIPNPKVLVKTSIPVEQKTKLEVVLMDKKHPEYLKIVKGLIEVLPKEAYSFVNNPIQIEIGKRMADTTEIKLNKTVFEKLDNTKEYVLPLVIKPIEGADSVRNHLVLHFKLFDVEKLPEAPNVKEGDNTEPAESKKLQGNALQFASNYKPDRLYLLNDGQKWNNWWVKANAGKYLTVNLNELKTVKRIFIEGAYWQPKSIKSVKVEVSNDGGITYTNQGVVTLTDELKQYIEFNEAVKVNSIRLSELNAHSSDGYIDITELYLVLE